MPVKSSRPRAAGNRARTGRRLRALAVIALIASLAGLAFVRDPGRFRAYVASAHGLGAHALNADAPVVLTFVDRRRSGTAYEAVFLAIYPEQHNRRVTQRFHGRTGRAGTTSRILVRQPGVQNKVTVRWTVAGRVRARWACVIDARHTG